MEFRNSLKKSFVFFLLIFLIGFSLAEIKFSETILSEEKEGITTMTFQGSDSLELITLSDGKTYGNAKPNSFIKIVNDSILEADLTALKEASWTFGNDTIKVQEGMRVVYKNGTLEVFGNEKESIKVNQDFEGTRKLEFTKNDEGNLEIKGTNFNVDGIQVQQGSLSIVNGGYVLGKNSLADWKGLTLGNGKDLFLATSESAYNSWEGSALFPEELRLRGKGEDFTFKFNEGNSFAHIDPRDNFEIKAGKGFEFSLENRNPDIKQEGKIPLMNIKGEFMMNQDSKTIYTNNGEILITKQKDGVLFNKDTTKSGSSTSPIELIVDGQKNRYIVSNFNGVATVPLDKEEGIFNTDERYANSIYWKRASVENRYNYPTLGDFSSITGKKLEFIVGKEIDKADYIRTLIDVYEGNPEKEFSGVNAIKILNPEDFYAAYKEGGGKTEEGIVTGFYRIVHTTPPSKTIYIRAQDGLDEEFIVLIHEAGHGIHYAIPGQLSLAKIALDGVDSAIDLQQKRLVMAKVLPSLYDENEIKQQIEELEKEKVQSLYTITNGMSIDNDWKRLFDIGKALVFEGDETYPRKVGFVRKYGETDFEEDIQTFREKVVGDPLFFQRHDVLGYKFYVMFQEQTNEGYLTIRRVNLYKEKIDLLKKHGFITEAEYDAVFNPENHFSPEEIAELMKKK